MRRRIAKYSLIVFILVSLYFHSLSMIGVSAICLFAYFMAYHGFNKNSILSFVLATIIVLSLYFNTYLGYAIVGISLLAYLGLTAKPVYYGSNKEEDTFDPYIYNPVYSFLAQNIYHHDND